MATDDAGRSLDELTEALQHVGYELWMMAHAAARLATTSVSEGYFVMPGSQIAKNGTERPE